MTGSARRSRALSRRDVLMIPIAAAGLAGFGLPKGDPGRAEGTVLSALEINHLALRVTDLDRSQTFYEQVLGMRLVRQLPAIRFMSCGPHFVALFRGSMPSLDHVCFTVAATDREAGADRLRTVGIQPETEMGRLYFRDPDGHRLQVTDPADWPAGRRPRPTPIHK